MYRVFHNKKNKCGPVHITIGDGGNWEGLDTKYLRYALETLSRDSLLSAHCSFCTHNRPFFQHSKPKWSAFREPSFGHGMFVVHNASVATWEWHRNVDGNKEVGDSVVLQRLEDCLAADGVSNA